MICRAHAVRLWRQRPFKTLEVAFGSEHGIIAFPLHFATSLLSTRRSAMTISWSDACKNAFNQPLQTKLNYAHGSCGATV